MSFIPSINQAINQSINQSLSVCLSACLSACLSVYLSIYLVVDLHIYIYIVGNGSVGRLVLNWGGEGKDVRLSAAYLPADLLADPRAIALSLSYVILSRTARLSCLHPRLSTVSNADPQHIDERIEVLSAAAGFVGSRSCRGPMSVASLAPLLRAFWLSHMQR